MNKYLTYATATAVIVASLVVTYHFGYYLPKENRVTAERACEKMAHEKYTRELESHLTESAPKPSDLLFTYSPDDKRCVYYSHLVYEKGASYESVYDLATQSNIAFYNQTDTGEYGNESELRSAFDKYFSKR